MGVFILVLLTSFMNFLIFVITTQWFYFYELSKFLEENLKFRPILCAFFAYCHNFWRIYLPWALGVFLSHIRSNDLLRRTFRAFGAPANFNLWGERRQPSPNDAQRHSLRPAC